METLVKYLKQNFRRAHSIREARLNTKFNMCVAQYEDMLKAQDYCCAICKGFETNTKRRNLSVDHCHVTGMIRGILCSTCNRSLGLLKDNLDVVVAMKDYLEEAMDGRQLQKISS